MQDCRIWLEWLILAKIRQRDSHSFSGLAVKSVNTPIYRPLQDVESKIDFHEHYCTDDTCKEDSKGLPGGEAGVEENCVDLDGRRRRNRDVTQDKRGKSKEEVHQVCLPESSPLVPLGNLVGKFQVQTKFKNPSSD